MPPVETLSISTAIPEERGPEVLLGTVALADCRWYGHHPTYFRAMARALLSAGYRVVAICPEPVRCGSVVELVPGWADRFHPVKFEDPPCYLPIPRVDHDPLSTLQRWRRMRNALRLAETETGWKVEFVFFCWLDSFLRFAFSAGLPGMIGVPWSGLYFRNHHLLDGEQKFKGDVVRYLKGDRLLRHKECHAVGLLDERPSGYLETHFGVRPVMFPDITNEDLPVVPTELTCRIRERARGRLVLGMISLEPRKGFLTLLRIAEAAKDRSWFFVFTGPFKTEWFSREEMAYLHDMKAKADRGEIDHLWLDLDGARIPDGEEYNSLVETFDIIMAVYPGWQGSSNALTKASVFRKPVLASVGGCIESRVREFRLGICIDVSLGTGAAFQAIECLAQGENLHGEPLQPRFDEYHRQHSSGQLQRSLIEIIQASLPGHASLPD